MTAYPIDPYAAGAAGAADPFTAGGGPVHVPSLSDGEVEALLSDLEVWTVALAGRFGLDHRTIPPCWTRHPGMLEALAALRDFERATFTETASPAAGVDWLRAVREVTGFLRDLASVTGCSATEHRTRPATLTVRVAGGGRMAGGVPVAGGARVAGGAPTSGGAPPDPSLP